LLQHVVDALEPVIDNLAVLDNAGISKAAEGNVDREQVNGLLTPLRELLEDDDTDVAEIIDDLELLPAPSVDQVLLKQLAKTVGEYDFEEALKVLKDIEASSGSNEQ